ncbi:MAG: TRAP transporter large permease subunit [Myxococcota bacterium]|nr:TRAP transporter large permease subunit [Myxococcota bacterium]
MFIFRIFDSLAKIIERISDSIQNVWNRLVQGPLQSLFFYLILLISALIVIVKAICEELDRMFSYIEKFLISFAFLIMVALSFLDYLRREVSFFTFEVQGGVGMSVVLMVWVGFLGASLATRQKKHLAVDATDRILSPRAAQLVKRFSALIAAAFCWIFSGHAMELVNQSLIDKSGQDALPLWDSLLVPINTLGSFLHPSSGNATLVLAVSTAILLGTIYALRVTQNPSTKIAVQTFGTAVLFIFGLSFISWQWSPQNEDGNSYVWVNLGETTEQTEKVDLSNIANLVGGDTGEGEEEDAEDAEDLAAFVQNSSGGEKFPMWVAQSVIPLSFLVMALRFLGLALSGRFGKEEEEEDELDGENVPSPPPALKWIRSTGRGGRDLIFVGLFPGLLLGLGATLGLSKGVLILMGAVLLVLIGSPLFLAIGVATLACVTLIQDISAVNIAKDMYEAVKKEELLAIPFFVLAGNLMTQGSIAERLVSVARAFMGKTPGGLGLASILACVIFAAISGSSPVTVIAVGAIMFPMLVRERYPENYSMGVLTSAGSLGIIIPPSVPMIIYAIMVSQTLMAVGKKMVGPDGLLPGGYDTKVLQVSPNDLFIAGVLPGLFIALMLAFYTLYQLRPTRPDIEIIQPTFEEGYVPNLMKEMWRSLPSMILPVLILGGIYGIFAPFGIRFTVTEAAAVAVVYALFVELVIHRELSIKKLPKVLSESGVMMGSLFLIIVLAIAFNKFLAEQSIPQDAAAWMQAHVNSKWQFLILVNIFLLLLGCVMDIISAILIVAPLLAPIAMSYGIHPLHFGIMFIVNLELGYLTPPLGINLFVASTVLKRSVVDVMKSVLPFLFLMLFCLAVIIFFPYLSLALV